MSADGERTEREGGLSDVAVPGVPGGAGGAGAAGVAGERAGAASAPVGAPAAARAGRFDRSIVEGPVLPAVWKIAWPTMLHNIIGGLQGMVDHAMVGHFVGYTGNAAIGVSWQIFLVVVVFVSSLYAGMGVLVARFAGQGDGDKVNRTVYQAFLTSLALSLGLALLGYFLAPALLDLVNAAPEVKAEALPYLRVLFLFGFGSLFFFMLGGALRAAGDARTPLRYGVVVTVLNIVLNTIFIPLLGTVGAAVGTVLATGGAGVWALVMLLRGRWVVAFPRGMGLRPDWNIIRSLFRFGLPTGIQGIAMNVAGVLLLRFIGSLEQSAAAQAAYAVAYTELFSLITFTSVGIMGATAAVVGQNLGASRPDRAIRAVAMASRIGLLAAAIVALLFLAIPRVLLGVFGMTDPVAADLGVQLMRYLSVSGFFITVALTYTGGLQGSGDTRSPLYISIISQIVVPLGLCFVFQETRGLQPGDIWLAIVLGHLTRATLSVARFRQGKWRQIVVDIEPART
ncbi:MAG TPA: MATE family efflux transporter [Longimicrobiales bacterium]